MKTLFRRARLVDATAPAHYRVADVTVDGAYITEVRDIALASDNSADMCAENSAKREAVCPTNSFAVRENSEAVRVIDCANRLMLPGLYNAHCHSAMTLFRGYGEDLPLDRWLHEKIFPAEELLTPSDIRAGSMLACAEMIKNGVVSFTDMSEGQDVTAGAVIESGMKANLSRPILSFDEDEDMRKNRRMNEAKALAEEYHGASDSRVLVDMSLHAEYTNKARSARFVSEYAAAHGLGMHIHISETESEHTECIARNGCTPLAFFDRAGALEARTTAAHCVYVNDADIALMARKGVTAAHNPTSNLKLGSGVMRLRAMLDAGVNVALGTDGVSSNNALDVLWELRLASILHKGVARRADETTATEMFPLIAENGARSQGRADCGRLEAGCRADLVLLDLDAPCAVPVWDMTSQLCYALSSADVRMTMCDGRVLYENGEYKTLDIERVRAALRDACAVYFDRAPKESQV